MRQSIALLDEPALAAIGFDPVTIAMFRNIVRVVGKATDSPTVPEVAADTESNSDSLTSLQLVASAFQSALSILEADSADLQPSDNEAQRRIADIEAELQAVKIENEALRRAYDDMAPSSEQALASLAKSVEALRDEVALIQDSSTTRAPAGGSAIQAFATGPLTVNGAGNAPVPLRLTASNGAFGIQIVGRNDHLGYIEFFKNDGTTLEGSLYGGTGKLALTNSAGADALVISTAGVALPVAFGVNGKTPQTSYSLGAASTDLATVVTLANNLRTMAINNGMGS